MPLRKSIVANVLSMEPEDVETRASAYLFQINSKIYSEALSKIYIMYGKV